MLITVRLYPCVLGCVRCSLGAPCYLISCSASAPAARWYHAVFHTITAVVGAGVLGLPYAIASLGLAGGLIALTVACIVSLYCSYLLASLHQINGKRYNSYRELGEGILGPLWGFWAVVPFQFSVMVGLAVVGDLLTCCSSAHRLLPQKPPWCQHAPVV